MRLLLIACSKKSYENMMLLKKQLIDDEACLVVKCKSLPEISVTESLSDVVKQAFDDYDGLVFGGAVGIAVRLIAPLIGHKSTDPAVVVIDESMKYCISLLAGHAGGANDLARRLGTITGALPVITTATDCEGKFAVDDFARKNHLVIKDWKLAKEISAAILENAKVSLRCEMPMEYLGPIPQELVLCESLENADRAGEYSIVISDQKNVCLDDKSLLLIPRDICVGIGCRKGTGKDAILHAVELAMEEAGIDLAAIGMIASVDLKKDEPGLLEYCKEIHLVLTTFSAEELEKIQGDFTGSSFVQSVTGVDNVCERSAVAACGGMDEGCLILRKSVYNGVTVALARKKGTICYE